jgi:hypothetical protein
MAAAALAAAPAGAQGPAAPRLHETVDQGHYTVTVGGRQVGFEVFAFTIHFDSLFVNSEFRQPLRGGDTLRKNQMLVVRHFDSELIYYHSVFTAPGRIPMSRGITVGDTVVTIYQEGAEGGSGMTHQRPGGRLYPVEANGYALLDHLFRELAARGGWQERRVNLVLLDRDTVVTSVARSLGNVKLLWGADSVETRKYGVYVGPNAFYAWVGPKGTMLRLEQPEARLLVERAPAKGAKKKAATASKPASSKGAPPPGR